MAEFRHDPLRCALYSFPWGEDELAHQTGLRRFQSEVLEEIGAHLRNPATRFKVYRKAISSGHGIGKSALIGHVCHWAKSTCIDCKIIITANTALQLATKTQPEMAKWFRLAINSDWFDVHVASIKANDAEHENSWRSDFMPWSEENPEAFAGAHNYGKRLVIIFDEASGISDAIYKVVEGALTDKDTEIIWMLFSQCTRSQGYFYEAVFGNQKHRWRPMVIDSRSVEGINVEEIEESIALYGENSDQVRVRWLGLFPLAGGGQYIDQDLIWAAQKRVARSLHDDPLVAGVDFAWGGADDNVIRFRKGFDARTIPAIKIKGEFTRDPAVLTGKLADVLTRTYNGEKVQMLFFDSAGIAAPVESRLRALGHKNIMVVNFGADSPDQHYAYMRDYMWGKLKEWLPDGAIDEDASLAADLAKPILVSDPKQRVKLEPKDIMKKRLAKMGLDSTSPDDGDALALTFAMPVAPKTDTFYEPEPALSPWM